MPHIHIYQKAPPFGHWTFCGRRNGTLSHPVFFSIHSPPPNHSPSPLSLFLFDLGQSLLPLTLPGVLTLQREREKRKLPSSFSSSFSPFSPTRPSQGTRMCFASYKRFGINQNFFILRGGSAQNLLLPSSTTPTATTATPTAPGPIQGKKGVGRAQFPLCDDKLG